MKINKNDAHDRLQHLQKNQAEIIAKGCDDCLKKNPDSLMLQERSPYIYIFAHARTIGMDERIAMFNEDLQRSIIEVGYIRKYKNIEDVPEKVILWQPRLIKPKSQTNSMLFRAQSKTDILEICWIIPPRELWPEFQKGNLIQEDTVVWSINQFVNNREQFEAPFPEDMTPERSNQIWKEIAAQKENQIRMKKLYATLKNEEALTSSPFYSKR